jgi:hypothetical protein
MGLNSKEMFNDMPLVSVLMFQKNAWEIHPEDMVEVLLQRVHEVERIK